MVTLYNEREISLLRTSGKILSEALRKVASAVRPGVTTYELDQLAEQELRARGGVPAFLGYTDRGSKPFPATLCTSINDELVHCVPYKTRRLMEGDIISLDLGVAFNGLITDMALTMGVGKISIKAQKLIDTTAECLEQALALLRPGVSLGDLGNTVQTCAQDQGFAVIRDLVGHGVGHHVHEDPKVPNFGTPGQGLALQSGMVLAIEPMLAEHSYKIKTLSDGWGIAMADGGLSAHFEKTVAITKNSCEVLTP